MNITEHLTHKMLVDEIRRLFELDLCVGLFCIDHPVLDLMIIEDQDNQHAVTLET